MSPKEALPALSFLGDGSDRSAFLSERSHQADPFDADLQLENHFPELAPWGSLLDRLEHDGRLLLRLNETLLEPGGQQRFDFAASEDLTAIGLPVRSLPPSVEHIFDAALEAEDAGRLEQAGLITEFTRQLADHLRRTAREPDLVPTTDDLNAVVDFCLQPRDVQRAK